MALIIIAQNYKVSLSLTCTNLSLSFNLCQYLTSTDIPLTTACIWI